MLLGNMVKKENKAKGKLMQLTSKKKPGYNLPSFESSEEIITLLKASEDNSLITLLVTEIFKEAKEKRASDVHFEPKRDGSIMIRFRIDGLLHEHLEVPKAVVPPLITKIKGMSGLNAAERKLPQDGRLSILDLDVRINTIPTFNGEKCEARILNSHLKTISEVSFIQYYQSQLEAILKNKQGLIIVTGPTGSGKSTTLHSFLDHLNNGQKSLVSLEEPVEAIVEGVSQINIDHKFGMSYAVALRSVLRQDPDIIMIGEIRDEETASIAANAAITGHLVLSTLHNNDVSSAITRLLGLGVDKQTILSGLKSVVSQRLVRKLCPHCKVPVVKNLFEYAGDETEYHIFEASKEGCSHCNHTGYYDRIAILEILQITPAFETFLMEADRTAGEISEFIKSNGFYRMKTFGFVAVTKGLTSLEELETLPDVVQ